MDHRERMPHSLMRMRRTALALENAFSAGDLFLYFGLSLMVIGILQSTDIHLSSLAEVIPLDITNLSLEQRVRRWLKNQRIDVQDWYEPFARTALLLYRSQVSYVVMDTTQFGPSCRALVVGVAYAGQVLPLGWRVGKGSKGHTDPQLQNELLNEIRAYLLLSQVVLLADSEFSSVEMLDPIQSWRWFFIARVRGNVSVQREDGSSFILNQAGLQSGQTKFWHRILWTAKHSFRPLMLVSTREKGEKDPLYVITNTNDMNAALLAYSWRFWIEPLFADFKGRGFHLAHTRIRDPKRLSRLLMVACIAFLWSLAIGSFVFHSPRQRFVDRNDRDNRSFFQLGYRTIKRSLKLDRIADILFAVFLLDTFATSEKSSTVVIPECFYRVSISLSICGFPTSLSSRRRGNLRE